MNESWNVATLIVIAMSALLRDVLALRRSRLRHESATRLARSAPPGAEVTVRDPDGIIAVRLRTGSAPDAGRALE